MIIEALLLIVTGIIDTLFSWVHLPGISGFDSIIDFLDLALQYGLGFVLFLLDKNTLEAALACAVVLHNADHIYTFFNWLISKIPFLSID